jgi:hypothetical protein
MAVCDLDDISWTNCDDIWHLRPGDLPLEPCCFYCGRRLCRVAVSWTGADSPQGTTIAMHADCAKEFGAVLIKDGSNASLIERFGKGQAGVNGIVPSLR